ncbi:XkdX family protein [Anaerovorax odorimutans]|nr:XkdX family protein [Anaerovorax odorimutans]
MTDFEKWDDRYKKHWCTKEQLQRLVLLTVLTAEQYKGITGEDYKG